MWIHSPNLVSFLAMEASHLVFDSQAWKQEPSATLRTNLTANGSFSSASQTASWTTLPFGTTSQPSTGDRGVDTWILLLAVSRANRIVMQANVLERKIAAIFGPTPYGSYGMWNRDTSSWKMSEVWLTGLTHTQRKSLGSFPRQGTMQSGVCTPLPKQALPIKEIDGGALPTPSAIDYGTNQGGAQGRVGKIRPSLQTMAKTGMWPTPTTRDWRQGDSPADKNRHSPNLPTAINEVGGKLNPTWVEWLMGLSIGWTDLKPLEMESYRQWLQGF